MSRPSTGRPEFRLRFGYPDIVIESPDGHARRLCIARGIPKGALRSLAAEIERSRGRLTAVLPEGEVWHSRLFGPDSACARRSAAAALGAAPEDLALRFGPKAADGARSAVATRRSTLRDARDYLARAGLKPDRITAPHPLPGFATPPAFVVPVPLHRQAAGLAAIFAVLFAGWAALGPTGETPPLQAALPEVATPLAALPAPAAPPALPVRLDAAPARAAVLSPAPRPDRLPPLRQVVTATPPSPALVPIAASARNALATPGPRFVPLAPPLAPPRARPSEPAPDRVATPTASARTAPGPLVPLPRPARSAPVATPVAAVRPGAPLPRPAAPASVDALVATLGAAIAAPAMAAPASAAVLRPAMAPQPRPTRPEPVQVAALGPAAFAVLPVARPEPRRVAAPAVPVAAVPAKKPAAAPVAAKPQQSSAARAPQQASAVRAPQAAPPAAAPARVVRTAPAPVQVVRAVPAQPARVVRPVATAPAAAAPQSARSPRVVAAPPAPVAAAAQPRREEPQGPALNRNSLALIGVFGNANGRHALVLLPNGQTQRVKPGDQIQGIQVTAIASDAIHLRAQGRDAVIRLPE